MITKLVSFFCPENITTAKIALKQCTTPKIFFKILVIIISGASNIDDMPAQIVIFQLVVNHKSWIGHQIQKGHLTIGGCILDDDNVTCTLDAAKHDLILLFGFKAINMIEQNILREFIFFFFGIAHFFLHNLFWFCLVCIYIAKLSTYTVTCMHLLKKLWNFI